MQNSLVTMSPELKRKLRNTLKRMSSTYKFDIVTPVFRSVYKQTQIDAVVYNENVDRYEQMDAMLSKLKRVSPKTVLDLETSERSKAGPKSWICPNWWQSGIDAFLDPIVMDCDEAALQNAQKRVRDELTPYLIRGYFKKLEDVSLYEKSFSGLPYLRLSGQVRDNIIHDAYQILDKVRRGICFEYYMSVIGHRGQPKGEGLMSKQRLIWQYGKAPVLVSTSWLETVIPMLRFHEWFVGWREPKAIDDIVYGYLTYAKEFELPVVSMDYSRMDSTITLDLVEPIFYGLPLFEPISVLLHEMFTSGICLPDRTIYHRDHGVPSGHGWTNFIDSLANLVVIHYVAIRAQSKVAKCTVLGDDSIVVYDPPINAEDISHYAAELGMIVNPTKTGIEYGRCHYLQKMYDINIGRSGIRSIVRTMNGMGSMESWKRIEGPEYYTARWMMQLNEVYGHPNRELLLEWLRTRDSLFRKLTEYERRNLFHNVVLQSDFQREFSRGGSMPLTDVYQSFWFSSR